MAALLRLYIEVLESGGPIGISLDTIGDAWGGRRKDAKGRGLWQTRSMIMTAASWLEEEPWLWSVRCSIFQRNFVLSLANIEDDNLRYLLVRCLIENLGMDYHLPTELRLFLRCVEYRIFFHMNPAMREKVVSVKYPNEEGNRS